MFTMGEIIDLAIRIENNGEKIYRKAKDEASSPLIGSMLQWLADDEAEHGKWFVELRKDVNTETEDPKLEEMGNEILQNVLGDQAFSMNEADFSRIEDMRSLLELSLEFEKDTIIFYEMLREFIADEKTLRGLEKIIEEEKRHVKHLEDFIEKKEVLPLIIS